MKEMQDVGIIVSTEEMQQLLEDRPIRTWLGGIECHYFPGNPPEFGIPLPPITPELPSKAETLAGQQFLEVAAIQQP